MYVPNSAPRDATRSLTTVCGSILSACCSPYPLLSSLLWTSFLARLTPSLSDKWVAFQWGGILLAKTYDVCICMHVSTCILFVKHYLVARLNTCCVLLLLDHHSLPRRVVVLLASGERLRLQLVENFPGLLRFPASMDSSWSIHPNEKDSILPISGRKLEIKKEKAQ